MKNGRVNERNIGQINLEGGLKRVKPIVEPVLTEEQYQARLNVKVCNMLLKNYILIYDEIPELVQKWINDGIVRIEVIDNPFLYARQVRPTIRIARLNEGYRHFIEQTKKKFSEI